MAGETLRISKARNESGATSILDVHRAEADLESARQNSASLDYALASARRELETLSGLAPSAATEGFIDGLHDEGSLQQWELRASKSLPAILAAEEECLAAQSQITASRYDHLPTLSSSLTQTYTNSVGLIGEEKYYTVGLTLDWRLDAPSFYNTRALAGNLAAVQARRDRNIQKSKDEIYLAWQQVHSQIVRSRAARAQARATTEALSLIQDRFAAGTVVLLDVLQAQRDAFTASVNRIQADGDLAVARALLRLNAGEPLQSFPKTTGEH